MASNKVVSPFYRFIFDTTAERLAYVFTPNDIGCPVVDLQLNQLYVVTVAGVAGASSMSSVQLAQYGVGVPLGSLRLVDATNNVGNIAAIGGLGASNSAPIFRGRATTNGMEWSWATGAVVALATDVPLPMDLDRTRSMTLQLTVNSGSTDAATMAVVVSYDNGTALTYSASDAATKSATDHVITATLLTADIPTPIPKTATIRITPPTHATNAIQLSQMRILYNVV